MSFPGLKNEKKDMGGQLNYFSVSYSA